MQTDIKLRIAALRERLAMPCFDWALALGVVAVLLFSVESLLRTERLWDLPLASLLHHANDTHTRATWRVHRLAGDDRPGALFLGSSTATAVVDLPWRRDNRLAGRPVPPGLANLIDLSVSRGCHADQLVLAENALKHDYRPELVVIFTWPTCFGRARTNRYETALYAERMPLTGDWLSDITPITSLDDRARRWWVEHTAVGRYQYFVNGWIRSRVESLLGEDPSLQLQFRPPDRSRPWRRAWAEDQDRYELVTSLAGSVDYSGAGMLQLETIVEKMREAQVRVLLVEAPWGPLMRTSWSGLRDQHHRALEEVARRHGAEYYDPNDDLHLFDRDFNDLFHVTTDAGARYYGLVAQRMASQMR